MKISSTTNLSEMKFDISEALHIKNPNIKEENRAASEITFIPWEDMNYKKCIGKDGENFEVVSYYRVKGETLNKDFLDVFSSKAQGKDVKCYDYYVNNFVAEITKNFSDSGSLKADVKSLKKGLDNLVSEMGRNISKGISNNIENLNTKFNVNGVDFTLKELMDSSKVMNYSNSMIRNTGSGLDYVNYAEMGIAKGKVKTYGERNLNEDQQKLLNDTMSARVEKIINLAPERADVNYIKSKAVDENNKFYSLKDVAAATNIEYARKIMDTFASVDYSNNNTFERATEEYRKLIKPVLESAGIKDTPRNQSLTDVTNYEIKQLKSLFDESYKRVFLSAEQVRKKFGNSQNIIDVCR